MIFLDTDILVDVIRGVTASIDRVSGLEQHEKVCISIVTRMELAIGCQDNSTLSKVLQFLHRFSVIALTPEASELAGDLIERYHLSHGPEIPDALIAATVICHGSELLTRNQRHFGYLPEMRLL